MQDRLRVFESKQAEKSLGYSFFNCLKKYDMQLILSLPDKSPVVYILVKKAEARGLQTSIIT